MKLFAFDARVHIILSYFILALLELESLHILCAFCCWRSIILTAITSLSACPTCEGMRKKQLIGNVVVFAENDLIESPSEMSKKKKRKLREGKKHEFLSNLNALLNEGGGIMCLHINNPHMLGAFEQRVNLAMAALVPDDTLFEDNFERHFKDENHVIFRVKRKRRPLSTLSFNTKISYDMDPTHGQMRYFLQKKKEDDDPFADTEALECRFKKDEEVKVWKGVFQKSMSVQAKKISKTFAGKNDRISELVELFFHENKGTFLPKYITAFSKLKQGGSIILGIYEYKKDVLKWTEVDEHEKSELLTFNKAGLRLWKDKNDVYLVAPSSPVAKESVETGEFICEGIVLTQEEQENLSEHIKRKVTEEMYWHPDQLSHNGSSRAGTASEFKPPVDVKFHKVEGGEENLVVVEVAVRKYEGAAFQNSEGPEAYHFPTKKEDGTLCLRTISKQLWFEKCLQGV